MTTPDAKSLLADLQRLLDHIERRPAGVPPMGAMSASLELGSDTLDDAPTDPRARYPVGHFGPEHGLNPQQAWQAEQILRAKPAFHGPHRQQREAARIRGIAVSVRTGKVGNSGWGRSMLATKGGNALRNHAPMHLHALAQLGTKAAQMAREGKRRLKAWQQRQPQTEFAAFQRSLEDPQEGPVPSSNFLAY
jgi:hypothetical protein